MPVSAIAAASAAKSGMPVPGISNVRTWRSIASIVPDGSISSAADTRSR